MAIGITSLGLSALAGVLSTLSPCVLPLVPILMTTAVTTHRLGPLALAGGVAISFTILGTLIASAGAALGVDQNVVRSVGAVVLLVLGAILLSKYLQGWFARATSGVSSSGHALLSRLTLDGMSGQFMLGLLLGAVWSPCVGPTLGAAATLASQGREFGHIALVMAGFGIGASLPMIAIGSLSRTALVRSRASLHTVGDRGKQLLGIAMLALGLLILTHGDRLVEAWLVDHSPDWLTALTTRF